MEVIFPQAGFLPPPPEDSTCPYPLLPAAQLPAPAHPHWGFSTEPPPQKLYAYPPLGRTFFYLSGDPTRGQCPQEPGCGPVGLIFA